MRTKFGGIITDRSVRTRIQEFREIGEQKFLEKYANGVNSRSTWISFEGDLFPAKAVYAAAHRPALPPGDMHTHDAYVFSRELAFELVVYKNGVVETNRSAIDDLDEFSGPDLPPKVPHFGERFVRDGKVRNAVLNRAKGNCEHCGEPGFVMESGRRYLETHHIIALAKQGPDSMDNVIALCPLDHRRAHYSSDASKLEAQFLAKLAKMKTKG